MYTTAELHLSSQTTEGTFFTIKQIPICDKLIITLSSPITKYIKTKENKNINKRNKKINTIKKCNHADLI